MFSSENSRDPEQPLNSYPRDIVVTASPSAETEKAIGAPWDVVPLHSPTLSDEFPVMGSGKVER